MVTCRSIINSVFKLDMKEHDYTTMWLEDANLSLQRGNKETARTMFDVAVELDPKQRRLWEGYVGLEYRLEDHERYREVLKRAAKAEGDVAQPFLLKLSKEHLRSGNPIKAKELLKDAVTANPNNEVLSLAYAEILKQMKETDKCRSILKEAEQNIQTANIWKYHIKLERDMGDISKALEVSKEAVAKFPYDVDLACDLSIVYEELNKFEKSRENYISLIKTPKCQRKSRPWIQYMHLEEKLGGAQKVSELYLGPHSI